MISILARMRHRYIIQPWIEHFPLLLRSEVRGCSSVLDIGCGTGSPLRMSRDLVDYMVGIDMYPPTLQKCMEHPLHDRYMLAGAMDVETLFTPASFDCVLASDLIEHLPKVDGFRFLEMIERLARKKAIIFTPNGFLPQGALGENDAQRHLSGWSSREMKALGYRVTGVHGWKPLRGEQSLPRWRPADLWGFLSVLTQKPFEQIPEQAFQIMCVKELSGAAGNDRERSLDNRHPNL